MYNRKRYYAMALVIASFVVAAIMPTAAQAHTSSASADCLNTYINYVSFANQGNGNGGKNTVHYRVTKNNNLVVDSTVTFTGSSASVTVPNPLYKDDVVKVNTWWAENETRDGHSKADSTILTYTASRCSEKPTPPSPPAPPVPPTPPAPPAPPIYVVPPVPPTPPAPPCVKKPLGKYKIVRHGRVFRLKGKGLSKFVWRLDGRIVGHGRSVRVGTKHKHVVSVTALVNDCQQLRKELHVQAHHNPPPRFTY